MCRDCSILCVISITDSGCTMVDITMCTAVFCPKKENCYRYTAKPCEYRQTYFVKEPVDEKGDCKHYWEVKSK